MDLSRRKFLQVIVGGTTSTAVVSSTVGIGVLHELWICFSRWLNGCRCVTVAGKKKLCNKCKELIITEVLKTQKGREQLARAMVEPIRRSLEYQRVGRKLLSVNELPGS